MLLTTTLTKQFFMVVTTMTTTILEVSLFRCFHTARGLKQPRTQLVALKKNTFGDIADDALCSTPTCISCRL